VPEKINICSLPSPGKGIGLLVGIPELLRHEVEVVPSGVGVDAGVEGEGDVAGLPLAVLERVLELGVPA
jgi:hypothetical protein